MASAVGQEASLQQPATPQNGKKAKNTKKKSANRPPPPPPEAKLFEQLGHSMVDKLVRDMQVPHDSPTLLDRLRSLGLINVQSSVTNTPNSTNQSSQAGTIHGFKNTFFDQVSLNPGRGRAGNSQTSDPASTTTTTSTSKINAKSKAEGYSNIFTLGDFAAVDAISTLTDSYGRVSHMGILDGSYSFFVTSSLNAALCFKVKDHICLVGGDPLCPEELFPEVLEQFAKFRQKHNWGIIFIGSSDTFASYAREKKWTTIQFGNERVLNPVTNLVLQEKTQKRIISQNRQLLNPEKGAITLGIYNPTVLKDMELQAKLVGVYEAWREARNQNGDPQAFITVFDPFAITGLMTYVYTMDRMGTPNGFAALRRIGANNGFHIDPCIAAPSAPRGISDLLIFSSMALLNAAGCSYLTFGYEPLTESGEIYGMPKWIQRLTRKTHKSVFQGLKVSGKKGYYDKWCPDEEQKTGLHLIFPAGTPGIQDIVAVMHFANISVRGLVFTRMKGMMTRQKKVKGAAEKDTTESEKTKRDTVESEKTKEKPTEKNTTEKPTTQTIKAEEGIVEVVSTSNQITQSTTEEMPVKEKAAKKKKQKAKKTSEKDTTENTATTADAALEVAQRDSGVEVSPEPAKEEETIELPPDASKANGTIDGELKGTIKQETDVSNEEDPPLPVRHPDHRLSEFKSETDP